MTTPDPTDRRSVSRRWGLWVLVVFGLQAGLLFWVSRKADSRPEPESSSGIQLVEGVDHPLLRELASEDPELLSQPNPRGFSETWLKPKPLAHQPHRWSPPDIELPYPSNLILAPLVEALASNAPPRAVAYMKPSPKLFPIGRSLAGVATVELAGNCRRPQEPTAGKIRSLDQRVES